MKKYQKLNRFPLGSLQPEGFLKEQLIRNKEGMGGHLDELEPDMIANPFINKTPVKRWEPDDLDGWGGEISANYWTGVIELAYTLKDDELIKKATEWVDKMLKNQCENGYLGTYNEPDAKIHDDFNAHSTTCAMRGLLAFYEATGRKDVLEAVHRCMLWFCDVWSGDNKTCYRGPYIIEAMVLCYYYTGDERLIDFCNDYQEYLCKNDFFSNSYKSYLTKDLEYNSNHTSGIGIMSRLPALIYTCTGRDYYLKATERIIQQLREKTIHPTGSPVSVTEFLGPVSSTAETEYCAYTQFNATYSYLSYITGEAKYGDYMEELFYNGAQGARKKDERAIAYLSSPNQIYATDVSSSSFKDFQVYSPCFYVACCPVNSIVLLPEFVRGMMLYDENDDIYMTAYGPCSLDWNGIKIVEKTQYPFRNKIDFIIETKKHFSVYLKIPAWCNKYRVEINGKEVRTGDVRKGFVRVEADWNIGDVLSFYPEMNTEVFMVDDSDACKKYPVAVRRGVLMYSYHIPEKWIAYAPPAERLDHPLPEGWDWYKVEPYYEEADVADKHIMWGYRMYQFTWNIALDENLKPEDIVVNEIDENGYPWENPMIKLKLKGYRAPYLCARYPDRTFEPFGDYQTVDKEIDVELVPYGCTNLRITYFPKADLKKYKSDI